MATAGSLITTRASQAPAETASAAAPPAPEADPDQDPLGNGPSNQQEYLPPVRNGGQAFQPELSEGDSIFRSRKSVSQKPNQRRPRRRSSSTRSSSSSRMTDQAVDNPRASSDTEAYSTPSSSSDPLSSSSEWSEEYSGKRKRKRSKPVGMKRARIERRSTALKPAGLDVAASYPSALLTGGQRCSACGGVTEDGVRRSKGSNGYFCSTEACQEIGAALINGCCRVVLRRIRMVEHLLLRGESGEQPSGHGAPQFGVCGGDFAARNQAAPNGHCEVRARIWEPFDADPLQDDPQCEGDGAWLTPPEDRICQLCQKLTAGDFQRHLLRDHFKRELTAPIGDRPPFFCRLCPNQDDQGAADGRKGFPTGQELLEHRLRVHRVGLRLYYDCVRNGSEGWTEPADQEGKLWRYLCRICSRIGEREMAFPTQSLLKDHLVDAHFLKAFGNILIKRLTLSSDLCPIKPCHNGGWVATRKLPLKALNKDSEVVSALKTHLLIFHTTSFQTEDVAAKTALKLLNLTCPDCQWRCDNRLEVARHLLKKHPFRLDKLLVDIGCNPSELLSPVEAMKPKPLTVIEVLKKPHQEAPNGKDGKAGSDGTSSSTSLMQALRSLRIVRGGPGQPEPGRGQMPATIIRRPPLHVTPKVGELSYSDLDSKEPDLGQSDDNDDDEDGRRRRRRLEGPVPAAAVLAESRPRGHDALLPPVAVGADLPPQGCKERLSQDDKPCKGPPAMADDEDKLETKENCSIMNKAEAPANSGRGRGGKGQQPFRAPAAPSTELAVPNESAKEATIRRPLQEEMKSMLTRVICCPPNGSPNCQVCGEEMWRISDNKQFRLTRACRHLFRAHFAEDMRSRALECFPKDTTSLTGSILCPSCSSRLNNFSEACEHLALEHRRVIICYWEWITFGTTRLRDDYR